MATRTDTSECKKETEEVGSSLETSNMLTSSLEEVENCSDPKEAVACVENAQLYFEDCSYSENPEENSSQATGNSNQQEFTENKNCEDSEISQNLINASTDTSRADDGVELDYNDNPATADETQNAGACATQPDFQLHQHIQQKCCLERENLKAHIKKKCPGEDTAFVTEDDIRGRYRNDTGIPHLNCVDRRCKRNALYLLCCKHIVCGECFYIIDKCPHCGHLMTSRVRSITIRLHK